MKGNMEHDEVEHAAWLEVVWLYTMMWIGVEHDDEVKREEDVLFTKKLFRQNVFTD